MDPKQLAELISRVKSNEDVLRKDEQTTLVKAIYPILSAIGWHAEDDQVVAEYATGTMRVDIALKSKGVPVVFVEAKRAGEQLHSHQQQLLEYAYREGVPLGCLTDGIVWWLYLGTESCPWEQRRFFTVDLREIPPAEAAGHLQSLIGRAEVESGSALQLAKTLHAGREKKRRLAETIPVAWQALCRAADEELLELFAAKVEGMCGYRPEYEELAKFLLGGVGVGEVAAKPTNQRLTVPRSAAPKPETPRRTIDGSYTGRTAKSFVFRGQEYPVHSFKEIILKLAEELWKIHGTEAMASIGLANRKGMPYISRQSGEMVEPRQLGDSGLWIESCLSAESVVRRATQIVRALGYPETSIEVRLTT